MYNNFYISIDKIKKQQHIKINDENIKAKLSMIKSRSDLLKGIEKVRIQAENESIGIRLEQK